MATRQLLTGFAAQNALRKKGTTPRAVSTNLSGFTYEESGNDEYAQQQINGRKSNVQSVGAVLERKLTITTQLFSFESLGLTLNTEKKQFTNVTRPVYREVEVPAGGGPVPAPGLVAGNLAGVAICYNGGPNGQQGPMIKISTLPTAAGSVQVAANTLTFAAADAGCVVGYFYDQIVTSVTGYGGAGTATSLGQMEFYGALYSQSAGAVTGSLWLPEVERESAFTVEFGGDGVPEIATTYNVSIPAGWSKAYSIDDLTTAVIP
jgi:hypothetical protein